MKLIRIDKFISENTQYTRRSVRHLLQSSRVTIDGTICHSADAKIDPATVSVVVDGTTIVFQDMVYIMLHKPAGVVSAVIDDLHQTVLDILPLPYCSMELFPVGRLDLDTEGFLIITNDGKLTHRLISPKSDVKKTYYVQLDAPIEPFYGDRFAAGIQLADGTVCLPAKLQHNSENSCYLTICEGKYHQVKRMFAAVGNHVAYLRRTVIGGVSLDPHLSPGQMRLLTDTEINCLKIAAGLDISELY